VGASSPLLVVAAAPTPLAALVAAAREKHEGVMGEICTSYHEARGERPITRPSLIPEDAEQEVAKVQERLTQLAAKAEDDRYQSVKTLRKQLLQIWRTLNLVGGSVFEDVARACRSSAAAQCKRLEDDFKPLAKDRAAKRTLHEASLKPTLRAPTYQAELRALAAAEADRSSAAVSAASELRDALLKTETEQAERLVRRLVYLSGTTLMVLDAALADEDLIPNDDPPPDIHHGVKKKLRMETRERILAATIDEPQEGRPFMTHVWPGLPLGELTPDTCEAATGSADAPPETKEGADEDAAPQTSAELRGNQTRPHRSVIAMRDRVYESYKLYYAGRVREIRAACDAALTEERRWEAGWLKLVEHMEIKPPQQ